MDRQIDQRTDGEGVTDFLFSCPCPAQTSADIFCVVK